MKINKSTVLMYAVKHAFRNISRDVKIQSKVLALRFERQWCLDHTLSLLSLTRDF